jgi:hypothetical protein
MTTYKRIKVYDGTTWQFVGAQIPQLLDAYGNGSAELVSGTATETVTFVEGVFIDAPLVFTQLTGTANATLRVSEVDENGFSVVITGTGTDTVTFNWFAVYPEAASSASS